MTPAKLAPLGYSITECVSFLPAAAVRLKTVMTCASKSFLTQTAIMHSSIPHNLFWKGSVLFSSGVFFTILFSLLQVQRNLNPLLEQELSSSWWIFSTFGVASVFIGLLYPCVDKLYQAPVFASEWPAVLRCTALFVGINHASAKLDFTSNLQLMITLFILSVGLWFLFDGTRSGFGLAICTALFATSVTRLMGYNGFYRYSDTDFNYGCLWLPCIFFSGGITVGNIGRQLAITDDVREKDHKQWSSQKLSWTGVGRVNQRWRCGPYGDETNGSSIAKAGLALTTEHPIHFAEFASVLQLRKIKS